MLGERADPHADLVQLVEPPGEIVRDDRDEARREPALRHHHRARGFRRARDMVRRLHVLGQIEIMDAGGGRAVGDVRG